MGLTVENRAIGVAMTEGGALGASAFKERIRYGQMATLTAHVPSLWTTLRGHDFEIAAFDAIGATFHGHSPFARVFHRGHASGLEFPSNLIFIFIFVVGTLLNIYAPRL